MTFQTGRRGTRFWLLAGGATRTNTRLLAAVAATGLDAVRLSPEELPARLGDRDVLLGRVDVAPELDGVEAGLWTLRRLEREPARVLNRASALLACHDKLETARALGRAGLPHPRTALVEPDGRVPAVMGPVVVKPRFGSWGRDIVRCAGGDELRDRLDGFRDRGWFRRHGALVQELVPPVGRDLRVVVALGAVVGAVERVAAPGEWRTNVALGAVRRPVVPPPEAAALALAAAAAAGTDVAGVDLLPRPDGGWSVLELNGAVDFTEEYSLPGTDVFLEIARRLRVAAARAGAGSANLEPMGGAALTEHVAGPM